ncbi:MAG: HD domain-containing protein [Firmicutes bacterium]|nr:HD domain-containing protein [Bacillota bacterium]
MKNDKIIDLFLELGKLRDVKRFTRYHPIFKENVAEHTFHMAVIADRLVCELGLNDLDYRKVMQLVFYHDVCELGMGEDYDGMTADNNPDYKKRKEHDENATIDRLAKKHGKFIKELYQEYKDQKTEESKFVKALDKLQCTIHESDKSVGFAQSTPEQREYAVIWAIKHIENFPKLKPLYRTAQERIKKIYTENKWHWSDDWFIK